MKKKITNSQELNNYYNIVNTKLKKYSDMNIEPHDVVKYLKPGSINFKKFINEDDELKDIDGVETILKDIIEDTYAAFKDGLLKKIHSGSIKKFENFLIKENIFNFETTDNEYHQHERVLADIYKISISYIEQVNKDIHLYSLNDDGVLRKVMVFNNAELDKVKKNIIGKLIEDTKNKHFIFNKTSDFELNTDKKILLKDVLNYDKVNSYLNEIITEEDVVESIANNSGLDVEVKFNKKINLNSIDYYLFDLTN